MARVALLHFTAEPCVGGVERILTLQEDILRSAGHGVRLIVGAGGGVRDGDFTRIPEMLPSDATRSASLPLPDDPRVLDLSRHLDEALQGQTDCWIHNALTVYLNPVLTAALLRLLALRPDVRWVAFCHDLTARTAFWRQLSEDEAGRARLPTGITYIVDSASRREELRSLLPANTTITVMPPPVDIQSWLGLTSQTRQIEATLSLSSAEPLVFVPAKLLPHKNLGLAVRVLAALRERWERPLLIVSGADSPHDAEASAHVRAEIATLARTLNVSPNVAILSDILDAAPLHATIRDLMLLADTVFLPSTEEGYGLPLMEAMALRCPVLSADIPPFREITGDDGWHFDLSDSPARIAAQIEEIAGLSSNRLRRLAQRSFAAYRQQVESLAGE